MKKVFTFLSLFIALLSSSDAQTLQFIGAPTSPYIVTDLTTQIDLEHFYIKNTTGAPVSVKAIRTVNDVVAGQSSYFCWDNCYDSLTNSSFDVLMIGAMDSIKSFTFHFRPNGKTGTATITMRFSVDGQHSDFINQTFVFNCVASSIDENLLSATLSAPAPNPASSSTNVTYKLPNGTNSAELQILNALGQEVRKVSINEIAGSLNISTSELSNGVYTIIMKGEGNLIGRRRLVVNN